MAEGWVKDWSEYGLDKIWGVNAGSIAAMVIAAHMDNIAVPRRLNNYAYSYMDSFNTIQGEVPAGGGEVTFFGTFTSNNVMSHAVSVSIHVDKINFPAFYYQVTDNPVVAVLNQIPYTLVWSVNIGTFLQQAPALPSAFNQQGKIFEQKFNLFKEWVQMTFAPQAETKIIILQQGVIQAPGSPGDLLGTGDIKLGDILLDQGHTINFGDGGKIFPQFP